MAADLWIISSAERGRHNEQFKGLGPSNGFITGEQAKGFFMQSTLPPQVLGVIWMLSDIDGDGKMSESEFSIACKLINLKLRGFAIPQTIPPLLEQSAFQNAGMSTAPGMPQVVPNIAAVPAMQSSPILVDTSTVNVPRRPSQDSGSVEWGIPQASKLKFTQVFNMSDRAKSGYLSGAQARNILIQSQLPHQALAQIWALSDVDNDGRLCCEEFVLAMYLCEQAKAGNPIPAMLPRDLIPPTLRKRSRASSVQSTGSAGTPGEVVLSPTSALDTSFEDKRRENFEKGQAELERRRKALLDAQRRETDDRLRREREEETKREKARQEVEKKQQDELEKEMIQQKEMESQLEAERKRSDELKEQARHEAERQRLEEWEKQRLQELMNVRQRQQENLLSLKAKNQQLTIDLDSRGDKVKEIVEKISETRKAVTEVKGVIDGMRSTRDKHMEEMNNYKAKARDQNQRLLILNQDKARLKARSVASASAMGSETAAVDALVANKQMIIKQLQEKLDELTEELSTKETDVNNNVSELQGLKDQLRLTCERCSELYQEFFTKRKKVVAMREKLLNPDVAWGDKGGSAWSDKVNEVEAEETGQRFQALYEFEARNHDELSFVAGDIIRVLASTGAEAGWLSGKLNEKIGWFPEAYCTPLESNAEAIIIPKAEDEVVEKPVVAGVKIPDIGDALAMCDWRGSQKNHLELIKGYHITLREQLDDWWFGDNKGISGWFPKSCVKVLTGSYANPDVQSPTGALEEPAIPECMLDAEEPSLYYQAVYPFQSNESGDLAFETFDIVLVVKKDGDWWHGIIEHRNGVFPSNYLQQTPLKIQPKEEIEVNSSANVEAEKLEEQTQKAAEEDSEAENREVSELTRSRGSLYGRGKKPEVCQVLAPYDATSANQLNLVRGQVISIRRKTASGWWEGELHAKGKKRQVGWFPASYVKIMTGSARTTPVSVELGMEDDLQLEFPPDTTSVIINQEVVAEPKPVQSTFERVEAIYPYIAQNDDELSFQPGDVIMVLDKEDAAWWKGSLRGQIGVFPSNYVKPREVGTNASPQNTNITATAEPVPTNATSPDDVGDSLCYANVWGNKRPSWQQDAIEASEKTGFQHFSSLTHSSNEKRRQDVIKEIISTEYRYLHELKLVQRAFIDTMARSGIVSANDLQTIFINWSEIILLSSVFNKALKVRCENSPDKKVHVIGDVLCQQLRLLTPYVRFCSLQVKGAALLNKKFEENGPWADFVRKCQENYEIGGHTLTSFLLKPMQRLTKYPLLIKELLLCTPESHSDYQNTSDAYWEAKNLCSNVNNAAQQLDNTEKLEWMQTHIHCEGLKERLIFNSLTNSREPRKLLHLGILIKCKSKRELLVFLLSDFLLVTVANRSLVNTPTLAALESQLATTTCNMYRKPIFLSEVKLEEDQDSETGFVLTSSEGELNVCTSTPNERNNWLKKITLAQKLIIDTELSINQRLRQKEKDSNIIGRVLISIMAGVDLAAASRQGNLHCFCEVSLGSQVNKTVVATGPNPKWDSPMQFLIQSLSQDVLCITVYEKGFFRPNEFMGRTEIWLQNLYAECRGHPGKPQVMKLSLQEAKSGQIILKASFQLFH